MIANSTLNYVEPSKLDKQIKVTDFLENIEDMEFMNRLHESVNRWIVEIRKVEEYVYSTQMMIYAYIHEYSIYAFIYIFFFLQ